MKAELNEHGIITLTSENPTEVYALKHWVMESWISPGDEMRMEIGHWRGSNLIVSAEQKKEG